MFKTFAIYNLAATAAIISLGLASGGKANANVLVNGWLNQPGPNGSQVCMTGPASGWSAAADWYQFAVVPGSYLCTDLETTGWFPVMRVRTNGGDWPHASQGNGIGQSFRPLACAAATYWYNVTSGTITGNLVSVNGAFIDSKIVLKPANNSWKLFTSIWTQGSEALDFETLTPVGIIPAANYQIMDADVEPCSSAPPDKDLSNYVTCAQPGCPPISFSNDPVDPWEIIQITSVSSVPVEGPIHMLLDGLTSGRAVVNPDGDYLGTPYVNLMSSSLDPGQSEDVTIHFNSDSTGTIPSFRVQLASGDF
jgi:hypothetical protein